MSHWNQQVYRPSISNKPFFRFCTHDTYNLFIELFVHISSCWNMLAYSFNTTCMYRVYILNVSVFVNELVFPSVYSVFLNHGFTNSNRGLWWVRTQENIPLPPSNPGRRLHSAMANILNCDILVSKFEVLSHNYAYFRTYTHDKGMNPLIPIAMG